MRKALVELIGTFFVVFVVGLTVIAPGAGEMAPLAIGAIEDKVVVGNDGGFEVRKKLRVTMSCDHRVIDGAVGAKFLQTLRRLIENPLLLVF